jgi:hypothetical protein
MADMLNPYAYWSQFVKDHGEPMLVRDTRLKAELMAPHIVAYEDDCFIFADGARSDKVTYISPPPSEHQRLQLERHYLRIKLRSADERLSAETQAADNAAAFSSLGNPPVPVSAVEGLEALDAESEKIRARIQEIDALLAPQVAEQQQLPGFRDEVRMEQVQAQREIRGRLEKLRAKRVERESWNDMR